MKLPVLEDGARVIKPGRAILATIGVRRVLTPGGIDVTKPEFRRSVTLENRIHAIVNEFLDGKTEHVSLPKYDHDDVSHLLFKTMEPDALAENLAQFRGSPAGEDFIAAADMAVRYLRAHVPLRFRSTFVGPKAIQPSRTELMDWRWLLETIGDPEWALRQLLGAMLTQSSVEALAQVWPDVLQAARMAATEGIADRLAKNPDLALSRRQVRQLGVLTGNDPTAPPELVQALQASFQQEANEQAAAEKARESAKPDDRLSTSVQRTANR